MYQKLTAVGNLGKDPEMKFLPSGQPITNFSIAVNRRYTKSDGEKVDETVWMRVSTFGKLAETCNQYLQKGKLVLVEGRLTADPDTGGPRIWQDSSGNSRASFEISAVTVQFLSGAGDDASEDQDPF